ncbi:MAG: ABC transporter permease [Xanthomonadales bacterium]|nr:ABC transporter permease [Xanthomonadales bacterium]
MLKNYLLIAWRNLLAHRLFSAINILGLAIGLACCILIVLFVQYELSYDRHYKDSDRIVRVVRHFQGMNLSLATAAAPFGPLLEEDFPEIEEMARLNVNSLPISVGDRAFDNMVAGLADPELLSLFEFEFVAGDPETALDQPFTLVLTESTAERLFGREDPLGETVTVMGQIDNKVTGVIRDLPENTHMSFDMVGSIATMFMIREGEEENFGSNNYHTYVRLPAGYDPSQLEAGFPAFLQKHLGEEAPTWTMLETQRLTDIHLHSSLDAEMKTNGNINIVLIFSAIAAVILTIACINFMNLTTARSTQRAKEVGMRKVVGADRSQLITQFLGESIMLTAGAMLIAVALVELVLPWFAAFVERDLTFNYLSNPGYLLALVGAVLGVGVIAGSYPAFHLSSFRPAEVLKGTIVQGKGSANLRKVLVVFQFAISITLMIATGVVLSQLNYTQTRDLGYKREHNLISSIPFQLDGTTYQQYPPYRDALLASPAISSVTISSRVPTGQLLDGNGYQPSNSTSLEPGEYVPLRDVRVGFDFFEHYGIELVAGRFFGEQYGDRLVGRPDEANPQVSGQGILSEAAVRRLGYASPEEAVGQTLSSGHGDEVTLTIVGVAKDFNFASLHEAMRPILFTLTESFVSNVSIKSRPGMLQEAREHVESVWADQFIGQSVNVNFLEERFDAMYRQEQRQAKVFGIFAGLAILVASLGLFGLASFTTERRTKEIGVRKVMGASVMDIVLLLTREFSLLVLLANLIAWPVAWYFMSDWLTRFAYAIDLSPLLFGAAALVALLIAWITVASQAGKAALSRPVLALRYE